jgi:hypothetical protein
MADITSNEIIDFKLKQLNYDYDREMQGLKAEVEAALQLNNIISLNRVADAVNGAKLLLTAINTLKSIRQ